MRVRSPVVSPGSLRLPAVTPDHLPALAVACPSPDAGAEEKLWSLFSALAKAGILVDVYYARSLIQPNARYLGETQRGKYMIKIEPPESERHVVLEWVPAKGGAVRLDGVASLTLKLGHRLAGAGLLAAASPDIAREGPHSVKQKW